MMSLVQATLEVLAGCQTEIVIFLFAVSMHSLLFGHYSFRSTPKLKAAAAGRRAAAAPGRSPTATPLVRAVRSLLAQGGNQEQFQEVLARQLQARTGEDAAKAFVGMLEALGRATPAPLLAAVSGQLRPRGIPAGGRLYEMLLRGYFHLHMHAEFDGLFREAEADSAVSPEMALLALRNALTSSNLESAMAQLNRLPALLRAGVDSGSPSTAPRTLLQQLVRLAVQRTAVPRLLQELQACRLLTAATLEMVVLECSKAGDASAILAARACGDAEGVKLTSVAYSALLRTPELQANAASLFEEAEQRGLLGDELLLAAADAAAAGRDASLTAAALRQLPASPAPEVAVRFIRLAIECPSCFGQEADATVLRLFEGTPPGDAALAGDPEAQRAVLEAALRQHKLPSIQKLMDSLEAAQQHVLLKALAARGGKDGLAAAAEAFQACSEKSTGLYNSFLDACIVCQDMEAAERIMKEATSAGLADAVTHNTMIKAFAQAGDLQRARTAVEEMRRAGGALTPTIVTFTEFIDATIRNDIEGVWALLDDMKACNLRPNHVTCAILLKSVQRGSRAKDVERILAVVDDAEGQMDEVMLSGICEACMRVGRRDLVERYLKRHRGPDRVMLKSAHSFGSVARAFGFLGDLPGAWDTWREMRALRIVPTSVTIGCMVEALVSNNDTEAGYQLVHEMLASPETKSLVNAVIYCSVLKGFSHQKQFERVWNVYDEMIAGGVPFSVAAFNALVDTCARSCNMQRVPDLLANMAQQGIRPNVVTYSTVLKGYCQENRLEKAFELLEEMKQSKDFQPDEITYNTLIDGCARIGLYSSGMMLVEEMQELRVKPSNFTLSVLAKLCARSRRPEMAWELCDGLAKKYGLRPNMQVYNNLIHAGTVMRNMEHTTKVFKKMLSEGVRTDGRTYSLLIKGYIACGMLDQAISTLRLGLGLDAGPPAARPSEGLAPELIAEAIEAIATQRSTEAGVQLFQEVRQVPGVRLDRWLKMRLTSSAVGRQRQ